MSSFEQIQAHTSGAVGMICPRAPLCPRPGGACSKGYTLLELLAVVVIIAAVAALAMPNLDRSTEDAELTLARANLAAVRDAIIGSAALPGLLADMRHVPGFRPVDMFPNLLLSPSRSPLPGEYPPFDVTIGKGWRGPYFKMFPQVQNTNPLHHGLFPAADDRRMAGDLTFAERGFFYDLTNSFYGVPLEHRALGDAWGNPIVLQVPPDEAFTNPTDAKRWRYARLVSAGPDGVLTTPRYDASELILQTRLDEARLAGRLSDGTLAARGDDLVLFLNRIDVYEAEEH